MELVAHKLSALTNRAVGVCDVVADFSQLRNAKLRPGLNLKRKT
jgi:hypothetical protein